MNDRKLMKELAEKVADKYCRDSRWGSLWKVIANVCKDTEVKPAELTSYLAGCGAKALFRELESIKAAEQAAQLGRDTALDGEEENND